jgi:hypothetical protein
LLGACFEARPGVDQRTPGAPHVRRGAEGRRLAVASSRAPGAMQASGRQRR